VDHVHRDHRPDLALDVRLVSRRGFFNSVLIDLGLLNRPLAFMASPEGAMLAVIVANWWRGFPFFGVSYLAGMQSIPLELYEAAAVDGANAWRRFWHITLPDSSTS